LSSYGARISWHVAQRGEHLRFPVPLGHLGGVTDRFKAVLAQLNDNLARGLEEPRNDAYKALLLGFVALEDQRRANSPNCAPLPRFSSPCSPSMFRE
jgi:hypothetical protein